MDEKSKKKKSKKKDEEEDDRLSKKEKLRKVCLFVCFFIMYLFPLVKFVWSSKEGGK